MSMHSMLMMPINVEKFVVKASSYCADAIMLDMEDAVASSQKEEARIIARESVKKASYGKSQIFVRVNNDKSIKKDIESAVCPELYGIVLPKSDDADRVCFVDHLITDTEREKGIEPGKIKLCLLVETPKGILNLEKLLLSSNRIYSVIFGSEDYCRELGVTHSDKNYELLYPLSKIIVCCKSYGVTPVGLMGSVAEFRNLNLFRQSALGAKELGCEGGFCIHPKQLDILNEVFTPSEEEVQHAALVVEAYEKAIEQGKGTISLEGKMIDIPVYRQAKRIIEQSGKSTTE